MKARAATFALLVVVGTLAAVGLVASAGGSVGVGSVGTQDAADNETRMGEQVSSFMESSAGETGEEVDAGMWDAAFENAPESARTDVLERRADHIDRRLAELGERKAELIAARENGTIEEDVYRARMSYVVGRMAALNRSINATERQAQAAGVDPNRFDRLNDRMANLTGPKVADVARDLAGGPPDDVPGAQEGSGNESDPPGEDPPGEGPPDDDPPDNGEGPPDDCETPDEGDGDQSNCDDEGNEGDDPPSDPPGDDPPGDPPGDDPPSDPPGDDPPSDPPGDDPPSDPPGDDPPGSGGIA